MCVYVSACVRVFEPENVWCHVQVQAPLKAPSASSITLTAAPCERLLTTLRPYRCVCCWLKCWHRNVRTHMHIVTQSPSERASQRYWSEKLVAGSNRPWRTDAHKRSEASLRTRSCGPSAHLGSSGASDWERDTSANPTASALTQWGHVMDA